MSTEASNVTDFPTAGTLGRDPKQKRVLDHGMIDFPVDRTFRLWATVVTDEGLFQSSHQMEGWVRMESERIYARGVGEALARREEWFAAQGIAFETTPAAEPPVAVQGPLLSTIHSQPSTPPLDIATDRPPAAANPDPKDRGDIIGWTSYTANNGQCLVVVDFVYDPLLFKASKGVRGWMSVRTAPSTLDDQEKARQVSSLQNYIFAKVVCNLDVLTGGKESA